jgi:endonuclease G
MLTRSIYLLSIAVLCCGSVNSRATQVVIRKYLKSCDAATLNDTLPEKGSHSVIKNLEIPSCSNVNDIIHHLGYSLRYNEKHEQAEWVAYELTMEETQKGEERTNNFKPDPLVKTASANNEDYAGSGFDRGHLAPAADMSWSSQAMDESFFYSNMSPQLPGFNRGIWKSLEEQVRTWAMESGSIYVVTGPILKGDLLSIGPNQVSIPKFYYKVVLDYEQPNMHGIGMILPNESSSLDLQHFAVSIDSVEALTGLDFFPLLPDDEERKLESDKCLSCWSWKPTHVQSHGDSKPAPHQESVHPKEGAGKSEQRRPTSVQCSGTTKAGTRCKHMTESPNGKCYQHGGN